MATAVPNLDALKMPIHKLNHRVWMHLCKAWVFIFRVLDVSHNAAITKHLSPLPTAYTIPSSISDHRVTSYGNNICSFDSR